MSDLLNNITTVAQFVDANADNTASVGSTWVDTQGAKSLTFIFQLGTLADADATFTPHIEYSDDGSTDDGDATDAELLPLGTGQEAAAAADFGDDDTSFKLGVILGTHRWYRAVLTPANNTGATGLACVAVLEEEIRPSTQSAGPQA